jgi:hypothetical protein
MDQAWTFQKCVAAYIEEHDCGPGGVPLPQPNESPAIPSPDKDAAERAATAALILGILGAIAYTLASG